MSFPTQATLEFCSSALLLFQRLCHGGPEAEGAGAPRAALEVPKIGDHAPHVGVG